MKKKTGKTNNNKKQTKTKTPKTIKHTKTHQNSQQTNEHTSSWSPLSSSFGIVVFLPVCAHATTKRPHSLGTPLTCSLLSLRFRVLL
eukprot:m.191993 g.191993  ORF g.191993 m.191993 type:complete len:87 (+) comp32449_c0_seq1:1109-1369(+)